MNRLHLLALPWVAASLLASSAAASGSGSILYVDNSEGTTLTLVDADSLKSIGEIVVGEKPHARRVA
jgi:hypothetical protein